MALELNAAPFPPIKQDGKKQTLSIQGSVCMWAEDVGVVSTGGRWHALTIA